MKKFIFFFAVLLFAASCGEKKEESADKSKVMASNVANISIDGMQCAEACGGKIKKELNEMACVKEVQIDFTSKDTESMAVVTYDGSQCGEAEFETLIESLVDGAYQVKSIEVSEL